jgi:hypothetical protein
MPIPVVCACSARLKVGDHLRGQHVRCPKCGVLIAVGPANGSAGPAGPTPVLKPGGLSPEERSRLEAQLQPGERLLWADKPVTRMAFLRGWLVAAGFFFGATVAFTILGILIGQGMTHDTNGFVFAGVPGVLGAGLLAVGIAWPRLARRRAERTVYALTDRRGLAWAPPLLGSVRLSVHGPAELSGVQCLPLTGGPDAVGHLIFRAEAVTRKTKEGRQITGSIRLIGFFYVRRAAEVERLMRERLIDPFTDRLYS